MKRLIRLGLLLLVVLLPILVHGIMAFDDSSVYLPLATNQSGYPAPSPSPSPSPPHEHAPAYGRCGERMDRWHPPVVNGCATGHEHGDPPPQWLIDAGYTVSFHGHFNTSPAENTAKHAAMKGFAATFNGVDLYLRIHAASNVLDRSARYHSYEIWARDPRGGVSHWQGWYNTGDPRPYPEGDRVPRTLGDPGRRPVMLVVDQASYDAGSRCEQWYSAPAQPLWGWDFGWTICGSTTIYYPGENEQQDRRFWRASPDETLGTTRRLEAAWYADRDPRRPRGRFWATQFGDLVNGPDDPRCSGTSTRYGVTYQNVCLEQYIAPSMVTVQSPDNAVQKQFDDTGVELPN